MKRCEKILATLCVNVRYIFYNVGNTILVKKSYRHFSYNCHNISVKDVDHNITLCGISAVPIRVYYVQYTGLVRVKKIMWNIMAL